MEDKKIINKFVEYLHGKGYPDLKVDRWPDKENRDSKDIDAVAGPFAIEHFSIDAINDQRRDSKWFKEVAGSLEKELSSNLKYRLRIALPYPGAQKGQDRRSINRALKSWITERSPTFPDGKNKISEAPGIPFEFWVSKESDRPPCLRFYREKPDDPSFQNRFRDFLNRKAEKLAPYKEDGWTTILLVESYDFALMDESTILEAIGKKMPENVDQLWYADTSLEADLGFYDFTPDIYSSKVLK